MTDSRDSVLEYVLKGGNGRAANDLVSAFYTGYPVERLRLLLASDDEGVRKTGVWIASELGRHAMPLLDDVASLLDDAVPYVRYYALEVVRTNALAADDRVLAKTALCVRDPDPGVREQALRCLSLIANEQLAACQETVQDTALRPLLAWLLDVTAMAAQDIVHRLADTDPLTRRIAAVGARRLSPYDSLPLQHAATSLDADVRNFAEREMRGLNPRGV